MSDEILATVHASAPRRMFGVISLLVLGGLLIYIALAQPPANLVLRFFLFGMGGAILWLSEMMRRATLFSVELTNTQLRSSDGSVIAEVSQIRSLERGAFAFKPSHGFLVVLKEKAPVRWRPGLWWRFGRRVGIGGVTPGPQTRIMADMISALIAPG